LVGWFVDASIASRNELCRTGITLRPGGGIELELLAAAAEAAVSTPATTGHRCKNVFIIVTFLTL